MLCKITYVISLIRVYMFINITGCIAGKVNDICKDSQIQALCWDQENCEECLQAHECCHYCYDEEGWLGRRCKTLDQLESCNPDKIEYNFRSGTENIQNDVFNESIQIRPQSVHVRLRVGKPQNISFSYKPAKNYLLDLYYLGDLSVSMKNNLEVFKKIGEELSKRLEELTKNYHLAYGSFLDKTAMPFYFTDEQKAKKPCLNLEYDCETGYLFKHRLNFTPDMEEFIGKVSESKITANIDDLDGALDAILQILVCGRKIGWNTSSRKIIVLATDSLLHTAGDGLLAGAVRKPIEECLLDDNGEHTQPLLYDYPDIGQIHDLLVSRKVNIIFAVKDPEKLKYYERLTANLLKDSSFVGELKDDSNILDLIEKGFYNFAKQVGFFINTTDYPYIDVKFFGNCDDSGYNETSMCYNVQNNEVKFIVQLTLTEKPSRSQDILLIEEKNIQENIKIKLEYQPPCKCDNYNKSLNKPCHNGGQFKCGYCSCMVGWTGELCEQKCDVDTYDSCRQFKNDTISKICYGNGDCICGKCQCYQKYVGKYCQYLCPVGKNRLVCSGIDHGTCITGECVCEQDFAGDDCSCSTLTSNCQLSDAAEPCGGKGKCVCNSCRCEGEFSGRYCENNKESNTLCELYKPYVEDSATNAKYKFQRNGVDIVIDVAEGGNNDDDFACETVAYSGNSFCTINFNYRDGEDKAVHLKTMIICYKTAQFKALTTFLTIFTAIVIGGILFIVAWKCKIYHQEQVEYKKFMNERKMLNQTNPLYKSPVTLYENPLVGKPINETST